MNITLITPPSHKPLNPDIDILLLAAILEKQGYKPEVVDADFIAKKYGEKINPGKILETITESEPDVAFFSAKNSLLSAAFAKKVKEICPETTTIIGSLSREDSNCIMNAFPSIDISITGEQEETFSELVNYFKRFKTENNPFLWRNYLSEIRKIKGIFYRENDEFGYQIVKTSERPLIKDLDNLPFAAFHLIPKIKEYHKVRYGRNYRDHKIAGITFGTRNTNNALRYRSPLHISAEARKMISDYGAESLNFTDNLLCAEKSWLFELCSYFKKMQIEWGCSSDLKSMNSEMVETMKNSGFIESNNGISNGVSSYEIPRKVFEFFSVDKTAKEIAG